MSNEDRKDFNAMLARDNGMPKIQVVTDAATIAKYGGERMYLAPPRMYDEIMKSVPFGRIITVGAIREYLARTNGADFTDPITAGIFVSIAAWASFQRSGSETPYCQGRRRAQPQIPGRYAGAAVKARGRGPHDYTARAEEYPLLRKGL